MRYEKHGEDGASEEVSQKDKQRERDVGIICVIIYDDLALEAWTQRDKRERKRKRERERAKE